MVNMTKPRESDSRERILDAARSEFAEKGFDGARVDEIAKRADVNKALIYYYFKGKDELLKELMRTFLEERRRLRSEVIAEDRGRKDLHDRVAAFDLDFLFDQRDILRVALMEDLKSASNGSENATILEHWLEGLAESKGYYTERGYPFRVTPRAVTALYFFHLFPAIAFAALGEAFAERTGLGLERVKEEYLKLAQEIGRDHFASVFGNSNREEAPEIDIPGKPADAGGTTESGHRPPSHIEFSPGEREALVKKLLVDGRLARFPLKEKAKVAVLEHVSGFFEPGRTYTEKEVNALIASIAEDYVKIRRYLVEYGYMDRRADGGAYWCRT
jgi:AcrR family transcriptional regulator